MHITAQWIHSNKTYYADLLVRLRENIRLKQEEIQHLESLLKKLHEPYGILKHLDINTLTALPEESEPRPSIAIMNPSVLAEAPDPPYFDSLRIFFRKQNFVWMGLLILALMCNTAKTELINQCVSIAGLFYEILLKDIQKNDNSKVLTFMLLGSCIHDILWFFILGYVYPLIILVYPLILRSIRWPLCYSNNR